MAAIEVEFTPHRRMQSDLERELKGEWAILHDEQLLGPREWSWGRLRCSGLTISAGLVPKPRGWRRHVVTVVTSFTPRWRKQALK